MTIRCARHVRQFGCSMVGPLLQRTNARVLESPNESWPRNLRASSTTSSRDAPRLVQIREDRLEELIRHEVSYMACVPGKVTSVQQILETPPETLAYLIRQEGPNRLAVRIRLLENLPGWQDVDELKEMHDMLSRWYKSLSLLEAGPEEMKELVGVLQGFRKDGKMVIPLVSAGINKLDRSHDSDHFEPGFLDRWMDSFFLSRIGTIVLADQLIASASKSDGGGGCNTGIIDPRCNATLMCERAAKMGKMLCQKYMGVDPVFRIENYSADSRGMPIETPCSFSFIPSYLLYIVVELLKNSVKATAAIADGAQAEMERRPISIRVCSDEARVAIVVSDRAGGIPFDVGDRIWSYLYGACARSGGASGEEVTATPLAGYGVGLPTSRLYARYLGGSLDITSQPGFGTQAHIILPTVDQVEKLPSDPF